MQSYQAHKTHGGVRDCGPFFLDVSGQFDLQHTSVVWCKQRRPSNEEVERFIEESWTAGARRPSREFFNGKLCRLVDCDARSRELKLLLAPVSFKEFWGTNLTNAHLRYAHGSDVLADALGVSAAVTTGDGFLLMGRRSHTVAFHPGKIHPIGGMVEPSATTGAPPNPFGSMLKELSEETGLSAGCVRDIVCLGLVRDKRIVQPELIFDVTVDADVETVLRALIGAIDASEHTDLIPICDHPAAVVSFIEQQYGQLTPVAVATLMLHGLRTWGSGWFATARGHIQGVV